MNNKNDLYKIQKIKLSPIKVLENLGFKKRDFSASVQKF